MSSSIFSKNEDSQIKQIQDKEYPQHHKAIIYSYLTIKDLFLICKVAKKEKEFIISSKLLK